MEPRRRAVVEHLARLDAVRRELVARGLDVGDDQVQALRRPGRGRVSFVPNWIEHAGARRRELDDPEAVVDGDVGVEPPAEARVELLRAIDVGDRDDDDLELHVDRSGGGIFSRDLIVSLGAVHLDLPGCGVQLQ